MMNASDPAMVVSSPITLALYAVSSGIVNVPSVITPFMVQPPYDAESANAIAILFASAIVYAL